MLCGYSPFRSDDMKELIRETTEAKIEFHERYWSNVSADGMLYVYLDWFTLSLLNLSAKDFVKKLLNPDPVKRPTALGHVDSDADKEIERYCHLHLKEVLKPSGFQSSKANEWVNYDGTLSCHL